MSTERPYHFAHLLQFKTISLKSDFIHVYSPRAGTDNLWGQNFVVNRKALSLCPFVASFRNISLKSDFIHIFSCFYTGI